METVTISTLDGTGTATRIEKTTYDYNAIGIRVSAIHEIDTNADGTFDATTKTEYLNDPNNFTGYSQVIQETEYDENSIITKRTIYTLGHDVLSQTTTNYVTGVAQTSETLFFGYDGHGSTRVLFDMAGAIATVAGVEQLFFYDAYGNLLNMQANQAATNLLYSGEQFDSKIGQQYLRARYYDPTTGRFNRLDDFAGNNQDPQSFHKYLYTHADPINGIDPSGLSLLGGFGGMLSTVSFEIGVAVLVYMPIITKVTTFAIAAALGSMIYIVLAEMDVVPQSPIPHWVLLISGVIASGGMTLQQVSPQLRSVTRPIRGGTGSLHTSKTQNTRIIAADPSYRNSPPYKSGTLTARGKPSPKVELVRTYNRNEPTSRPEGRWVMEKSEIRNLTPAQIKEKYALPHMPTDYVEVEATEVEAVIGIAGPNFGHDGGGTQIELLNRGATFSPPNPIPSGGIN